LQFRAEHVTTQLSTFPFKNILFERGTYNLPSLVGLVANGYSRTSFVVLVG